MIASQRQDPDRNKAVSDDVGPSPSPSRDRPANTDDQRVKELEDKVWTLELDNKVKENLLLQAKERGEAGSERPSCV